MTFSEATKRKAIERANKYWTEILDSGKGEMRITFSAPHYIDIMPVFHRESITLKDHEENAFIKEYNATREFAEKDFIALLDAMLEYVRGEMIAAYDKEGNPACVFKGQPVIRIQGEQR